MERTESASTEVAPDLDTPLTAEGLAEVERIGSRRKVYEAIYAGMPHLRRGRAVRITRRQWRAWWAAAESKHTIDPVLSERARNRALAQRGER
jgi:hypothetical protein